MVIAVLSASTMFIDLDVSGIPSHDFELFVLFESEILLYLNPLDLFLIILAIKSDSSRVSVARARIMPRSVARGPSTFSLGMKSDEDILIFVIV